MKYISEDGQMIYKLMDIRAARELGVSAVCSSVWYGRVPQSGHVRGSETLQQKLHGECRSVVVVDGDNAVSRDHRKTTVPFVRWKKKHGNDAPHYHQESSGRHLRYANQRK